jgi:hypothetical protein
LYPQANNETGPARLQKQVARAALAATAVGALVATPLALAAVTPKTGYYTSSRGHTSVAFSVLKKGRTLTVSSFTIACYVSSNSFGSIFLSTKSPTVSNSGKFSYDGPARRFKGGSPAGTATLKFSGHFVSATSVSGTASFSGTTLSGCPSKSFTAKRT